ncbi:copper resistance protein CopC [Dactylosporangium vinaceum]|uniref:Copper resistance protein CopC n=1 Tax=Dactylosporangium vinaceum TaxID=53362 RepID=A0ABV5ME42_9ACTN|nr:copper resistance CopC family protein [Dactylosporangium vinaceum]UAB92520.1 copper resistance protein CopC [Dactylosporangium vinaceum]
MRLRSTLRGLLAATVLVVLAPATPAWAHSKLLSSDPADGATVSTPLTAVSLTFNEGVQQQFSTVVVTGADGQSYVDGTPRVVDRTLSQAVRALPAGEVTVAWRTVSADGHPVEGRFAFTNATPGAASPAPAAAPGPAADAGPGPDRRPWPLAGGALAVALVGGALLWRRWRRRSAGAPRM